MPATLATEDDERFTTKTATLITVAKQTKTYSILRDITDLPATNLARFQLVRAVPRAKAQTIPTRSDFALFVFYLIAFFWRRSGIHPRIKSEGVLRPKTLGQRWRPPKTIGQEGVRVIHLSMSQAERGHGRSVARFL